MTWNDWPIVCFALSTLLCLLTRRWMDAIASACFAVFMILDKLAPPAVPLQLKYAFTTVGVILVVHSVLKDYRRYRNSLPAR